MRNSVRRFLPAAVAFLIGVFAAAAAKATVPAGFVDELVTNVAGPTGLAFTPDGRLLITTQPGSLRVYQSGALVPTAALDLGGVLCSNSERGLLGVAVDPAFASNRFIYLYYTLRKGAGCPTFSPAVVNRVSRFVLPASNVVNPATEVVLIDNLPSWAGNHNGGDVQFGRDGYLYISVGDGGCDYAGDSGCAGANDAARDQHILLGKVLRIDPRGATPAERIPPTNPFLGADSETCAVAGRITTAGKTRCQETFAWGLRNPFRIAFDPSSLATRFFINDVGQNAWEEIDEAAAGLDYGWNCREGAHTNSTSGRCAGLPPSAFRDPIYEYSHDTGCASITGGAFVPTGSWPTIYDGVYLFSDYVCGQVFLLVPNGTGGYVAGPFATNLGNSSAVALLFGPSGANGALNYTTYAGGGQVRRIRFTGSANRAPVARMSVDPASGPAPLLASFDGSGSSDPDAGDSVVSYIWSFGDGSAPVVTAGPTTAHLYAGAGTFTAALIVLDEQGAASDPVAVIVGAGNEPPVPAIISPSVTTRFRVGEVLTLVGTATDADEGQLPDSALTWTVLLHHNDHTHPFLGPVAGNNVPLVAPPPEDLAATETSFLEVRLTATDRLGAQGTVARNLLPRLVDVTFATVPPGLQVVVNGQPVSGRVVSWEGYALNVDAPSQSDTAGRRWFFASWSDAGARNHTIVTPATPATYAASFSRSPLLDWNGDGTPDVVWQDRTAGFLAVWYMDGAAATGTAVVTPSQVPASWTIAGAGDFNGDGKPDILWQDRTSGLAIVWSMDGVVATGLAALVPSQVATSWRIAGVADLNADGKPDILWQDDASGSVGAWIMDGVTAVNSAALVPGSVPANWRLAGAADVDRDGKPDLVWRDVTGGQAGVWFMDGLTRTGFAFLSPAPVPTNWRIAGVADLNGDGRPDILWQDDTAGFAAVWFMDGVTVTAVAPLGPGQVDPRWQIVLPK
jgi:glucose/arabinose dehydrogenase